MLEPSEILSLKNQFSLKDQQIDTFTKMLQRIGNNISKPELLKIFSQYQFNQQLFEQHIDLFIKRRMTESAFKKIHKSVIDSKDLYTKPINIARENITKVNINKSQMENGKFKISYNLYPDGTIKNFSKISI